MECWILVTIATSGPGWALRSPLSSPTLTKTSTMSFSMYSSNKGSRASTHQDLARTFPAFPRTSLEFPYTHQDLPRVPLSLTRTSPEFPYTHQDLPGVPLHSPGPPHSSPTLTRTSPEFPYHSPGPPRSSPTLTKTSPEFPYTHQDLPGVPLHSPGPPRSSPTLTKTSPEFPYTHQDLPRVPLSVSAKYVGQPDISRCSSPVSDGRLKNACPNVRPNFQTFINNLTDTNIRKYSSTNHERPVYSNKMRIFHKGTLLW